MVVEYYLITFFVSFKNILCILLHIHFGEKFYDYLKWKHVLCQLTEFCVPKYVLIQTS